MCTQSQQEDGRSCDVIPALQDWLRGAQRFWAVLSSPAFAGGWNVVAGLFQTPLDLSLDGKGLLHVLSDMHHLFVYPILLNKTTAESLEKHQGEWNEF